MSDHMDMFEDVSNPLDCIEDMLAAQEWMFDRPNPDELCVHVSGRHGQYRMTFIWQEEFSAMQFFCDSDIAIPQHHRDIALQAIHKINSALWLGHFIVAEETGLPTFRHTSLFRGCTHTSGAEHIEDLIEIALGECERYYSVFSLMGNASMDDTLLSLALSQSQGEA